MRAAFALAGMFAPGPAGVAHLADRLVWEDSFDGRFDDRDYAMKVFEKSNEEVRRRVPPGRLLVFDVREGWEPLCEFLGVEVPDKPFPASTRLERCGAGYSASLHYQPPRR